MMEMEISHCTMIEFRKMQYLHLVLMPAILIKMEIWIFLLEEDNSRENIYCLYPLQFCKMREENLLMSPIKLRRP